MQKRKLVTVVSAALALLLVTAGTAWASIALPEDSSISDQSLYNLARNTQIDEHEEWVAATEAGTSNTVQSVMDQSATHEEAKRQEAARAEAAKKGAASRKSSSRRSSGGGSSLDPNSHLAKIAKCESGGNPGAVSRSGKYRGKYQFDQRTWEGVGGSGDPAAASEAEQDARAAQLYSQRGSQPWRNCA